MKFSDLITEEFDFPDGSYHCKIDCKPALSVTFEIRGKLDFVKLATQVDAVKNSKGGVYKILKIPYIQSARQDRLCDKGEPFTAKVVANLINSLGFHKVITVEPHSDVLPALINNIDVIGIENVFNWQSMINKPKVFFVSPDGGAIKRTLRVAKHVNKLLDYNEKIEIGVVFAEKIRNAKTGEIESITVREDLSPDAQYIV